jgi:hypothetical protein
MKKRCPQEKPGKHIYKPPAPKEKMWNRSLVIFQRQPYGYYVSYGGGKTFCELVEARKLNCADTASVQNGHAQWFVNWDHKRIDSLVKEGREIGHAIFAMKCFDPNKKVWEWWYMDRPPIPMNKGGYGKGYPKMPIRVRDYLSRFKGKVRIRKTWMITNAIKTPPTKTKPFRLP